MKSTDINFLEHDKLRSFLKKEVLLTKVAPALGLCLDEKGDRQETGVVFFSCCFCKSRSCLMKVYETTQDFSCGGGESTCGIKGDIVTVVSRLKKLLPIEAMYWLIRYVQPGGISLDTVKLKTPKELVIKTPTEVVIVPPKEIQAAPVKKEIVKPVKKKEEAKLSSKKESVKQPKNKSFFSVFKGKNSRNKSNVKSK